MEKENQIGINDIPIVFHKNEEQTFVEIYDPAEFRKMESGDHCAIPENVVFEEEDNSIAKQLSEIYPTLDKTENEEFIGNLFKKGEFPSLQFLYVD